MEAIQVDCLVILEILGILGLGEIWVKNGHLFVLKRQFERNQL